MITYFALIEDPKSHSLFEEIYYKYRSSMRYIAMNVLHDRQLAEDAVAEAFLKVAKNISVFSEFTDDQTRDYISTLTKYAAIDIYRDRQKQATPIDFTEEIEDEAFSYTIEDQIFSADGYKRLLQIIENMNTTYRDTFKLYYVYNHSAFEIAELLGIPENTVYARLSRARKQIVKILNREGEGIR